MTSRRALVLAFALTACDARAPAPAPAPAALPSVVAAALTDSDRTIPYSGYVDFDGQPVNASGVHFTFALYPCGNVTNCQSLWNQAVTLPIFAGRFTVELGGANQSPLPDTIFEAGHEVLYLSIQIEGKTLGNLQKIAPATHAISASEADRLRVRSAVEVDDGAGAATLHGDDGLVIDHSDPAQSRLLKVGPLTVARNGVEVPELNATHLVADQVVANEVVGPNAFPFRLEDQNDPFGDASQIAFLRFEGNFKDELGLLDGYATGNPTFVPGRHGLGLKMRDENYYQSNVNVPITGAMPRTLALWVHSNNEAQDLPCGLIGWGSGLDTRSFYLAYAGMVRNEMILSGNQSSVTVDIHPGRRADLAWHYLVGTYDGRVNRFYIDGVMVGEIEYPNITTAGKLWNEFYGSCDSTIDSARVFTRALSPWEIQTLYYLGN